MLENIYKELAKNCKLMHKKGWCEANAGNISVNISNFYPKGLHLLITASGSKAVNLAKNPKNGTVIVKVNTDDTYTVVKGNLKPSSEISSHILLHKKLIKNKSNNKVIVHSHLPKTVALSHQKKFNSSNAVSNMLFSVHPEIALFLPNGVGFVNYCTPGSMQLAKKTSELICQHNVLIWQKHGALACGQSISQAFDYLDILEKAIEIYINCLVMGNVPDLLSDEELNKLKIIGKNF